MKIDLLKSHERAIVSTLEQHIQKAHDPSVSSIENTLNYGENFQNSEKQSNLIKQEIALINNQLIR